MIYGIGRIVEHNAMLAIHHLLHRVDGLIYHTLVESDASHGTPALALDEDLSFLVLLGTYFIAVEVVGSQIPLAVPTVLLHSLIHTVHCFFHCLCLSCKVGNTIF